MWLLKALPSREEPDISLSIMNSKHAFLLMLLYSWFISPTALNTRSNDFIRSYMIERVTSRISALGVTVRDEGSVAGKGRVVGVPKVHSWGKCTMPLTNINSDWMSNTSSGL